LIISGHHLPEPSYCHTHFITEKASILDVFFPVIKIDIALATKLCLKLINFQMRNPMMRNNWVKPSCQFIELRLTTFVCNVMTLKPNEVFFIIIVHSGCWTTRFKFNWFSLIIAYLKVLFNYILKLSQVILFKELKTIVNTDINLTEFF
jgi:hypothetical protein